MRRIGTIALACCSTMVLTASTANAAKPGVGRSDRFEVDLRRHAETATTNRFALDLRTQSDEGRARRFSLDLRLHSSRAVDAFHVDLRTAAGGKDSGPFAMDLRAHPASPSDVFAVDLRLHAHDSRSDDFAYNGPPSTPRLALGDLDGDGRTTLVDALFALQAALSRRELTPDQRVAVDVNDDGRVNLVDALFILQASRGRRVLGASGRPAIAAVEGGQSVAIHGVFVADSTGMARLSLSLPQANGGAGELLLRYDPARLAWAGHERSDDDHAAAHLIAFDEEAPGFLRVLRIADEDAPADFGDLLFQPIDTGVEIEIHLESLVVYDRHGRLVVADGESHFDGSLQSLPTVFALHQSYPNPFNPEATIRYDLPVGAGVIPVQLVVYNVLGQVTRILIDEDQRPGFHLARWDGRNDHGQPVASGAYLYRLTAGEKTIVRRMLLLR